MKLYIVSEEEVSKMYGAFPGFLSAERPPFYLKKVCEVDGVEKEVLYIPLYSGVSIRV